MGKLTAGDFPAPMNLPGRRRDRRPKRCIARYAANTIGRSCPEIHVFYPGLILLFYAFKALLLFLVLYTWRTDVLKTLGTALLLASGLAINAAPAVAMQIVVTQVDKNTDGSMTYHFAVKLDQGETLAPRQSKDTADFVTVYNFYGLVDGSVKSPAGWQFSSENSGRTPAWNGYPLVLPVDIPNTPNLTWTVTKPVEGGTQVDGFSATTHVGTMVQGEYTAQVTLQSPAIKGVAAGVPGAAATETQQAVIGMITTPKLLADMKQ
jgi:hypothetical protein